MAAIKRPANILRGGAAIRPIQRTRDFGDAMATVEMAERARLAQRTMPTLAEPPRVSSPNTSGVPVKPGLGGASGYALSNRKAR